jgi:hypothetical protein
MPTGPGRGRPTGPQPNAGQTASGLARRVRGAQLPNTAPVLLRRSGAAAARSSGPGGAGGTDERRRPGPPPNPFTPAPPVGWRPPETPTGPQGPAGARPDDMADEPRPTPTPAAAPAAHMAPAPQTSAAKDVYGFLSDFTAGVQRGLDESSTTSGHPATEPPEGPEGQGGAQGAPPDDVER